MLTYSASGLHSVRTCLLLYILLLAFVVRWCFCWFDLQFWDLALCVLQVGLVSCILWFTCFISLNWCISSLCLFHHHHRVMATSETSTRLRNKKPVPQLLITNASRPSWTCNQCASASAPLKGTWFAASLTLKKSLEFAHNGIKQLHSTVSTLETHLQAVEADHHKQRILDELRSKEYSVLIHGVPIT